MYTMLRNASTCLMSLYWTTKCYITVQVEHTQNFVHRNELIHKKTPQSWV